jgi:Protein of unknown function (DUF4236)
MAFVNARPVTLLKTPLSRVVVAPASSPTVTLVGGRSNEMPARFRKSINLGGGVKLNLNKKSVSLSAGTRGARYTVSSSGQRTSSVGIPGTGVSYRSTVADVRASGSEVDG